MDEMGKRKHLEYDPSRVYVGAETDYDSDSDVEWKTKTKC